VCHGAHRQARPEGLEGLKGFLSEVALLTGSTAGEPDGSVPVRLMTLHGSKGLEFDAVFIVGQ
jgi:superfamily I DNA/RNA helicase